MDMRESDKPEESAERELDVHEIEELVSDTDLISRNPRFKKPALRIMELVDEERDGERAEIENAASVSWSPTWPQAPSAMVDILVRNRALEERIFVNGELYAGKFEDIQRDESVPDDAEVNERLALTAYGHELLAKYRPSTTLRTLFDDRPGYDDVFQAVLWACDSDEGCSRTQLEEQIDAFSQLKPDSNGQTRIYPQYFIDAMETAGGIAWDGSWKTTDAGRELMKQAG